MHPYQGHKHQHTHTQPHPGEGIVVVLLLLARQKVEKINGVGKNGKGAQ